MKNKLWLIALIAVIGFMSLSLAGCDNGGGTKSVPVTGVSLNKTSIFLNVGNTETLTATIAPDNATKKAVTWSTSDSSVAAVSKGVVTAVAAGTAVITVKTADGGKTAECSVTVSASGVNQTPTADDFTVSGLSHIFDGSSKTVTISPNHGKSTGAITIYYAGEKTAPSAVGSYPVTFDVEAAEGWNAATGLSAGTMEIVNQIANPQTPAAGDFNIGNLSQTAGSVTAVTITPKAGKSGGQITIYYNNAATIPQTAGSYTVTFDIASAYGWIAATGLSAGTLTVNSSGPTPTPSFTAPPTLTLVPDNEKITYTWTASTPEADTYDVYWKAGAGSYLTVAEVKTGTKIAGAASGGTITGLTNDTVHYVIVTANKAGYASVDSAMEMARPAKAYIITGSGSSFSASKFGLSVASGSIQTVINGIRTNAAGADCVIQFGNGTAALNIGTASASFNNSGGTWGMVELTGKITGTETTAQPGTITIADAVSIISTADIANTSGRAVYNASTGAVTITGGTVSATTGCAVYNASTGAVTITGGTVSATSRGYAVYNASTGAITITGGTVSSAGNSSNASAIRSTSAGDVTITGGTVSAPSGYAITFSGVLTFDGNPNITGRIFKENTTGTLRLASGFKPSGSRMYNLYFNSFSTNVVVAGGASYISYFSLFNQNEISMSLAVNGADIVWTGYKVEKSGTTYTITKGIEGLPFIQDAIDNIKTQSGGEACTIQFGDGTVLDINNDSAKFNNSGGAWGMVELTGKIKGSTQTTGTIAIADAVSITSTADIANTADTGTAVYNTSTGAVTITGGTVSATSGTAVYNGSNSVLTISGGTVSATTGVAVSNRGTITVSGTARITSASTSETSGTIRITTKCEVTISGGTVENTRSGTAIYINTGNSDSGNLNITGGTVSATSGRAVYITTGSIYSSINISGGTVSATSGSAVYIDGASSIKISGGTVSATSGIAVNNNYASYITVSGTAKITSANTNTSEGTLFNKGNTNIVDQLQITGGTIENTSTTTGNTIRANNGSIYITGGTISKAGNGNYALYSNGGSITVRSGATIIGNKYGMQ